jgi:hypothetical protein
MTICLVEHANATAFDWQPRRLKNLERVEKHKRLGQFARAFGVELIGIEPTTS